MVEKQFMVVHIGDTDIGNDYYHHSLVAADGESWQVSRERDTWELKEIIDVPMIQGISAKGPVLVPDWEQVHATNPVKLDLSDPHKTVSKWWGLAEANKHFTSRGPASREKVQSKIFTANMFSSDNLFADFKAKMANQFVQFVESGFSGELFSHDLYEILCARFDFDFMPNREAFFEMWFSTAGNRYAFALCVVTKSYSPKEDFQLACKDWMNRKSVIGWLEKTSRNATARKQRMEEMGKKAV